MKKLSSRRGVPRQESKAEGNYETLTPIAEFEEPVNSSDSKSSILHQMPLVAMIKAKKKREVGFSYIFMVLYDC